MATRQGDGGRPQGRAGHCPCPGKYIALAVLEKSESSGAEDDVGSGGLTFGISSWHIRKLVDNPWDGGAGYSYEQVSKMTPDQIYHRLCKEDVLKSKGGRRTSAAEPAALRQNPDGTVNGVDEHGNKIALKMRVGGKSLARRLMEEAEAKKGS